MSEATKPSLPTGGGSLTKEQIQFYETEGYLILPQILNQADLAPTREAMAQKVDEIAWQLYQDGQIKDRLEEAPFETRLARLFDGLTSEDILLYEQNFSEQRPGLFRLGSWRERRPGYFHLMKNPKILDAVESLIGSEIFANPVYNIRPKVPRVAAGAVPWHQDKSYWPDANANPVITVWLAFVDCRPENGCLHILPRTHKTRLLSCHNTRNVAGTRLTEIDKEQLPRVTPDVIALPLAKGGAILFNDRCIHMSTPNLSDGVRWSVDLRYQPTDQDPMPHHGTGFLARSYRYPERVAMLDDWLAYRAYHLS